jgi:ATP-binding cassette subfamily B protein
MVWLEDFVRSRRDAADLPVPERITSGIAFENVTFTYPGASQPTLEGLNLVLPAAKVVAIVGENGAGKTTLVKLIGRYYDPSAGRVCVDGVPLNRIPPDGWRQQLSGAFQDFFRFEYRAQRSIGVGDRHRLDERAAVESALLRAGAADVVDGLEEGLDTQLGATWSNGVELSFGQWQKVALARAFMRDGPLVLLLDEPTAALDAETEHALFESYAAATRSPRGREVGQITVLVSHRFSTIRMADLIVVMDGGRVAESGSHDELIALNGRYAELYGIQAAGYR